MNRKVSIFAMLAFVYVLGFTSLAFAQAQFSERISAAVGYSSAGETMATQLQSDTTISWRTGGRLGVHGMLDWHYAPNEFALSAFGPMAGWSGGRTSQSFWSFDIGPTFRADGTGIGWNALRTILQANSQRFVFRAMVDFPSTESEILRKVQAEVYWKFARFSSGGYREMPYGGLGIIGGWNNLPATDLAQDDWQILFGAVFHIVPRW